MKSLVISLVLAASSIASADSHQVLVLKAEGSADPGARTRIEQTVLRLAKSLDGNVVLGEITYGDAAAATGCKPEAPACRDEVMATLSVDEIVITSATVAGNDLRIDVRLAAKGQPLKSASATVPLADPSDAPVEAGIGPLFGVKPANPAISTNPNPNPGIETPPRMPDQPPAQPPANPTVTAAPNNVVDTPNPENTTRRKLEYAGIAGGAGMVVLGVLLWGAAGQTQNQIDANKAQTPDDFKKLKDLENQGDAQAGLGNLLFVTGVVIGGLGGYFLWSDTRTHTAARVAPTPMDHGAGVTLTIGGY